MKHYRRFHVPGATYYFEVCLQDPSSTLLVDQIAHLRRAWKHTQAEPPFVPLAAVVLPNKLQTIWSLPAGDADFSERWRLIKLRFTLSQPGYGRANFSQAKKGERGLWQRRFWEHMIRDEADLARHMEHIRRTPWLAGLVADPADWPYMSFAREALAQVA
jgi:putative transposase